MFVATLMWKRMTDLIDPQNSGTRFSDKPTFKSLGATDKNDTNGWNRIPLKDQLQPFCPVIFRCCLDGHKDFEKTKERNKKTSFCSDQV